MGMDADVVCVGMFSKDVINCLDYPEDHYKDTRDVTIITSTFFHCNTSEQSRSLAVALGARCYDFNTHAVKKDKVNWAALEELAEENGEWEEDVVEKFKTLLNNSFICVYRPNY